jgi:hypothetical protein
MAKTVLTRTLELIENQETPLSLTDLAREINQTPARTQEIVEYWMRRGRIQASGTSTKCGACAKKGSCPFIMELPQSYKVVSADQTVLQKKPKAVVPNGKRPMNTKSSTTRSKR